MNWEREREERERESNNSAVKNILRDVYTSNYENELISDS